METVTSRWRKRTKRCKQFALERAYLPLVVWLPHQLLVRRRRRSGALQWRRLDESRRPAGPGAAADDLHELCAQYRRPLRPKAVHSPAAQRRRRGRDQRA